MARLAQEELDETVEPPLPGPLLHKFVEEKEKTQKFVLHEPAVPRWARDIRNLDVPRAIGHQSLHGKENMPAQPARNDGRLDVPAALY